MGVAGPGLPPQTVVGMLVKYDRATENTPPSLPRSPAIFDRAVAPSSATTPPRTTPLAPPQGSKPKLLQPTPAPPARTTPIAPQQGSEPALLQPTPASPLAPPKQEPDDATPPSRSALKKRDGLGQTAPAPRRYRAARPIDNVDSSAAVESESGGTSGRAASRVDSGAWRHLPERQRPRGLAEELFSNAFDAPRDGASYVSLNECLRRSPAAHRLDVEAAYRTACQALAWEAALDRSAAQLQTLQATTMRFRRRAGGPEEMLDLRAARTATQAMRREAAIGAWEAIYRLSAAVTPTPHSAAVTPTPHSAAVTPTPEIWLAPNTRLSADEPVALNAGESRADANQQAEALLAFEVLMARAKALALLEAASSRRDRLRRRSRRAG